MVSTSGQSRGGAADGGPVDGGGEGDGGRAASEGEGMLAEGVREEIEVLREEHNRTFSIYVECVSSCTDSQIGNHSFRLMYSFKA